MMSSEAQNRRHPILGRVARADFVGRDAELQRIVNLARRETAERGLFLLAPPGAGLSELLRQSYDALFHDELAIPIYFAWSLHDRTASAAARHFLQTFLLQLTAYRRREPALIDAHPTLNDLLQLAAPSDYVWLEQLLESYEQVRADGDERQLVRLCLSAPQRAAAGGVTTVLLFDDVHLAEHLSGETALGAEVARACIRAGTPFVIAGLRRRVLEVVSAADMLFEQTGTLHLDLLSEADARSLIERWAARRQIRLNGATCDLIVQELKGRPFFLTALLRAAQEAKEDLDSFLACQRLYVDELLGGRINRRFAEVWERIVPNGAMRRAFVRALYETANAVQGQSPVEAWLKRLSMSSDEVQRTLRQMHAQELINFSGTFIEVADDTVWRDYLEITYRLEVAAERRALVVADTLLSLLMRAPQTMARRYRSEAALHLRELLARFNCQRVPASLLHYDRFSRMYKGMESEAIASALDAETDLVLLPQIIHTAPCLAFHQSFERLCEEAQCVVAHGFDAGQYAEANQIVWLAAEIEAKVEVGRALAEMWHNRLVELARSCGFKRFRVWLVAPAGFSAEACEFLREREAYGSNRQQLEFLTARLSVPLSKSTTEAQADEFEMVIPIGEDTELIAAHTVEQIARRLNFEPEAINQIKVALVEACLNVAEHSLSPERKIYQRFRAESDRLVITVWSRGVAFHGEPNNNGKQTSGRSKRGLGLKLIRTLMDEVEFKRVDDGACLRMTKYLHPRTSS
jgi:serine/threonine-protein kinase RsbW